MMGAGFASWPERLGGGLVGCAKGNKSDHPVSGELNGALPT
jgi:hypothetical protein